LRLVDDRFDRGKSEAMISIEINKHKREMKRVIAMMHWQKIKAFVSVRSAIFYLDQISQAKYWAPGGHYAEREKMQFEEMGLA